MLASTSAGDSGEIHDAAQAALKSHGLSGGWTGTVEHDGEQIGVKNGLAHFNGQVYIVSDDGRLVVDQNKRLVGVIQNGKVENPTPEIIDQLQRQGATQNGPS